MTSKAYLLFFSLFYYSFAYSQNPSERVIHYDSLLETSFSVSIQDGEKVTFELVFDKPEVAVDACRPIYYESTFFSGIFFRGDNKEQRFPVVGVVGESGIISIYYVDTNTLEITGLECDQLTDSNGQEINYLERFTLGGVEEEDNWTDGTEVKPINEAQYQDSCFMNVKKYIFLEDNQKFYLSDHCIGNYRGEVIYETSYETPDEINFTSILHHEWSCWDDYIVANTKIYNKASKTWKEESHVLQHCDKYYVQSDGDDFKNEVIYTVISPEEKELGSFQMKNGKLFIIDEWK